MIEWNDNAKAAVRAFADYIGQTKKCHRYLESFASKKTVADAVEQPNFKATRENLEKIAKDAQGDFVEVEEGEKWTHTHLGDKCRVIHEYKSAAWVVIHGKGDRVISIHSLKPIKPKLTKAQAWDIIQEMHAFEGRSYENCYLHLFKSYDIVEGPAND